MENAPVVLWKILWLVLRENALLVFNKNKTAKFVQLWIYWPEVKITGLQPVVQCIFQNLHINDEVNTNCLFILLYGLLK